jgi:hypothetical protein
MAATQMIGLNVAALEEVPAQGNSSVIQSNPDRRLS